MGYFLHRLTRKPLHVSPKLSLLLTAGAQLAASDLQTAMTSGSSAGMDQLTPMPGGLGRSSPSASSKIGELPNKPLSSMPTTPPSNASNFPTPISSNSRKGMGRGLQLGSSTKGHVNGDPIADFARDLEDEMRMPVTAGGDNPWGNDDLMDINADEDDWSMPCPFFTRPEME